MVSTFGGEVALEMQQKNEQAVRSRRLRDEERRKRFLNSRTRLMGVDTSYLDRQVAEKQARKEAEKAAEKMYGEFKVSSLLRGRRPKERRRLLRLSFFFPLPFVCRNHPIPAAAWHPYR